MIKKQLVLENFKLESIPEIMNKLDNNYKNYKKHWCFSVENEQNNRYIISASNRNEFISLNRGDFHEFMKKMFIDFEEINGNILVTQVFKYQPLNYVYIKVIPFIFILATAVLGIFSLVFLLLSGNVNFWVLYALFLCGFLSVVELVWTKGAKKLELQRYNIIEEILQKKLYCIKVI